MNYKDYTAKIIFDDNENIFHGEIINIRDVITFQGSSVEELKMAFADSVNDYLDFCNSRKEKPETPLNGFISLNIPLETQKKFYEAAKMSGKDFDDWAVEVLTRQVVSV